MAAAARVADGAEFAAFQRPGFVKAALSFLATLVGCDSGLFQLTAAQHPSGSRRC